MEAFSTIMFTCIRIMVLIILTAPCFVGVWMTMRWGDYHWSGPCYMATADLLWVLSISWPMCKKRVYGMLMIAISFLLPLVAAVSFAIHCALALRTSEPSGPWVGAYDLPESLSYTEVVILGLSLIIAPWWLTREPADFTPTFTQVFDPTSACLEASQSDFSCMTQRKSSFEDLATMLTSQSRASFSVY
eukprot:Blabericola_migrator_1__9704@NODE_530_length_7799_cov_81_595447_g404_i0_p5_GENE_NODE_530_length_7799_cov_81_595447_g404_i0NODE_530_length_7799_cov_81_595447_g404_i0_p5_ORF_typecomplete_len189_score24_507tm_1/PF00001_21/0_052_NODE_530_length_7799_cov_81_595447_g404_i030533619